MHNVFFCVIFYFSVGYYIEPTIVEVKNPHDKLMEEVKKMK